MTTTTKAVEFNVGDKVTVTDPSMGNYGKTGTVASLKSGYRAWPIKVEFKAGDDASYAADELALVEPPFTFADIQVGDTIRRTQTFKSGATEVREGEVEHVKNWYVSTAKDSYILAYDHDTDAEDTTLELLNRPEPEPVKEVWEDAKPGDVFKRVNDIGEVGYVVRTEDGWRAIYTTDSRTWSSSFDLSSTHLFGGQTITKV